jgi:Ni/Fe-hydrogenase subunit HybB-like protein
MSAQARPIEGPFLNSFTKVMLALFAVGMVGAAIRFSQGLGAATAMNDGYPWGLWIAFDVVVGTGLASGGYAMALMVYILNKGRYHPLVRPALVTSALGYGMAGIAVAFDLGRFWNMWKIPTMPWTWNGTSVLLEVAVCMMAYTLVLVLELSPAWLEKRRAGPDRDAAASAAAWLPRVEKVLPLLIALGLVLPTMHQSSLGSLLLLAPTKMHPLWLTRLLPGLFLLTAFSMGFAVLFFESTFSAVGFGRKLETRLLATLGGWVAAVIGVFLVLRFAVVIRNGSIGLAFGATRFAFFFWLETVIFALSALLFLGRGAHQRPDKQLQAAVLAIGGGALYRIDVFLIAYDPGANWNYFPSVGEIFVTLGLVAAETLIYVYVVRKFPILAGAASQGAVPNALKEGATP